MNFAYVLADAAGRWPSKRGLVDLDAPGGAASFAYGELADNVGRLARGLIDRGLVRGDRVALLQSNGYEYVEAFLAIAWAGLVSVPLNVRLLESELAHMLRDSGARLLIIEQRFLRMYPALANVTELGCVLTRVDEPTDARRFESLHANMPIAAVELDDEALASLMYTSGTTGLPKGVMLPHRSWLSVANCLRRELCFADDEVTLHTAALTHGSGFLLLPTMQVGGTNLLCNRFDALRTLSLYESASVTGGFMVPSMIQMLLDANPGPAKTKLRNLYYAGSPIDPATLEGALRKFGPVLVQSFAQMEVPMVLTMLDRETHARAAAGESTHLIRSAGRPLPGVEIRLVDDDDRDVPPGAVGEIAARAPQTMIGYWNRSDATAETLRNGWLHTGDLGRFDADGYLYIVDRKKDMIISGGSNIYAREVEEVLLGAPGIREVAVIGLPDRKWGEIVTAVLVAKEAPPAAAELERYCRESLADYRRPKRFVWVDALPRNAYGKVLKRELRDRIASSQVEK